MYEGRVYNHWRSTSRQKYVRRPSVQSLEKHTHGKVCTKQSVNSREKHTHGKVCTKPKAEC